MTPPTPDLSGIVGPDDVRGEAGTSLTPAIARALGAAFADHQEAGPIIVAHDLRLSSDELATAFVDGAVRRGSVVGVSGAGSTDQLYCASGRHGTAGAMITASHNPASDNGIKLCGPGARPISRDTGLEEIRRRAEHHLAQGGIEAVGDGRTERVDTLEDYVDVMLSLVPVPEDRPLRVVVDAANAVAGLTVPAVARHLPTVDVVPLHFTPDGTFPNHPPNPTDPANLEDLRHAVRSERADLGLAFDGDADRCVLVDETGTPVPPSAVTALIAVQEIARARAAGEERPVVVANLVSSRHVDEVIRQAGGRRIRSRVGHSRIKALMAEHDAVFGGEHSAHYYFRDFSFADSGLLAALHVLAALAATDRPLSALVAAHNPYPASGEINSRVPDVDAAVDRVRTALADVPGVRLDDLDGLTAVHWDEDADAAENWWFSLRGSHTEPLLRLNVEAASAATLERVRDAVLALVRDGATTPTAPADDADPEEGTMDETASELPAWVMDRVRCPDCGGHLVPADGSLHCADCGRDITVEDGIPVLLPRAIAEGASGD